MMDTLKRSLGRAELFIGAGPVAYAVWRLVETSRMRPEHVGLVWGYALGLSFAFVGIFGFGIAGAALARGHRQGWYLQLLILATLLVREPVTLLAVARFAAP